MNFAKEGDGLLGGSPTSGMLAGSTGLEPAASGVTGRRSNQLNYDPKDDLKLIYATRDADFRLSGTSNVSDCRTQFQRGIVSTPGIFNLQSVTQQADYFGLLRGGRYRTRTCDSRRVKPVLYQLS